MDCSASDAANNTATDSFTVTVTSCSPDATSITAGDQHTCALFDNGTARCWGTVGFEDYVGHHWQRLRRDDHLMRHASGALYRRGWPELN
ncbi:MAG: RCC1 domain-containing protein [Microthrixaceae bacterium]|nr:RCC1 domain-containing protein [Microthrixaceae bacterium]